jgi:hypothetical protein
MEQRTGDSSSVWYLCSYLHRWKWTFRHGKESGRFDSDLTSDVRRRPEERVRSRRATERAMICGGYDEQRQREERSWSGSMGGDRRGLQSANPTEGQRGGRLGSVDHRGGDSGGNGRVIDGFVAAEGQR